MTELIRNFLRSSLKTNKKKATPLKLPSYPMGPAKVDLSNRDSLYDSMDKYE